MGYLGRITEPFLKSQTNELQTKKVPADYEKETFGQKMKFGHGSIY